MNNLLTASAVIELGAGLALLGCPSAIVEILVGAPLETPAAWTAARVGGAAILALAVACWLARSDATSRAATGLVAAMLVYNVATVALLEIANLQDGLHGILLWPGILLHSGMALWCITVLRRSPLRP